MEFNFNNQLMPMNTIDIPEIGSFAIEASNDEGMYYYLLIRTSLGVTTVCTWGPVVPDIELIPSGYKFTLDKMDYNEGKIAKTISKYLNDYSKKITNADNVEMDYAIRQIKDVQDYLYNYSEDLN